MVVGTVSCHQISTSSQISSTADVLWLVYTADTDSTKLSCLVCSWVHTTNATRQDSLSSPCRRCEQAISSGSVL